jgi:glutathione synthase/RimK-type ligase-like ATP-grasp enzyme
MSHRKKIAFVTSEADPNLIMDDRLVIEPLRKMGIDVEPLVWDRPPQDLFSFDAFVFRSCWNYHRKQAEFEAWLNSLRALHVPVLNSVEINLWNLSKKYLLDLEGCGVVIPETTFLPAKTFEADDLNEYLHLIKSEKIIVKPAVSLNGEDTFLIDKNDPALITKRSMEINDLRDLLLQQFIPEIQTGGEISLIYFNRQFCHGVRKTAKQGEFRIHEEHGGSRVAYIPDAEDLHFANSVVDKITENLLFCRVDIVKSGNKIYLIELEIMDPMLFLGMDKKAPERFALAIDEVLSAEGLIFL